MDPNIPQTPTIDDGLQDNDGHIDISWIAVPGALSYLIHYGDKNDADPKNAIYMGYSETNAFSLAADDVPVAALADKIYFFIQAFNIKAPSGSTNVEKAAALHDYEKAGNTQGSAWSLPIDVEINVAP